LPKEKTYIDCPRVMLIICVSTVTALRWKCLVFEQLGI